MANASNGNTHVFINDREITKVELRMLQAGTKLVCSVFSLPLSCKAINPRGEEIDNLICRPVPDYRMGMPQKLHLVGYNGSGTCTILKQANFLYKSESFSEDKRHNIKLTIQSNIYNYVGILIDGRERFEEECLSEIWRKQLLDQSDVTEIPGEGDIKTIYSIGPRLKVFSDWLLKLAASSNLETFSPAATREYARLVKELWKDASIQATFNRRSELQMLPTVASYFLDQVFNISRTDYEPSNLDILYAEGINSSDDLACVDFSFHQSAQDSSIYASNQNEPLLSGALINKMVASRRLFESIVTNPIFEGMDFLLILNKFDLLEEKIEQVPLTQCSWFMDFNPVTNIGSSVAQLAFHYTAAKFKRHFRSLTGRNLYVSLVNGLESDTVDEALRYASEILKWDEERVNFSTSECSGYSSGDSFSS